MPVRSHREAAVEFLALAASGKVREAYQNPFENDRVVELWDIGQAIPEQSVIENGMF